MTAVKGHLTATEFPAEFKTWSYPPPDRLFDAPIQTVISPVSLHQQGTSYYDRGKTKTDEIILGLQEPCQEYRKSGQKRTHSDHLDGL